MGSAWGVAVGVAIVAGASIGPVAVIPVFLGLCLLQVVANQWNWWFLAGAIVLTLLGAARAEMVPANVLPDVAIGSEQAGGKVVSMVRGGVNDRSVLFRVERVGSPEDGVTVEPFTVWLRVGENVDISRGDTIEVRWVLTPLQELAPGFAGYLRGQGVVATAWAWKVDVVATGSPVFRALGGVRAELTNGLMAVLPGDRGALAAGVVTGDDSGLSDEAKAAFRATGTSHITAVSGSNVAIVLSLWAAFVPVGHRRRSVLLQVVIISSVWAYAILTGLEPPVVRAATMSTLMLLGARVGRRPDPLTLLALTAAAMVLWNPNNTDLIAFWLSVVATAAIISRLPIDGTSDLEANLRGIGQGVLLAQVATFSLVLMTFGTWSLVSLIANVVLAPLMLVAFPLCFVLAGMLLVGTWLAQLFAWIPSLFLGFALQVVSDFAPLVPPVTMDQPGAAGALLVVVPCLLAALVFSRDGRRWLEDVEEAWVRRPALMAALGAGSVMGLAAVMVVALMP